MSPFAYRAIERILVVLGGMLFAYLGYRLFLFGVTEGFAKLEGSSSLFKISFSGTGPGLFFMVFGGCILLYALHSGNVTHMHRNDAKGDQQRFATTYGRGAEIDPAMSAALARTGKSLTASGPIDRISAIQALTVNLPPPTPEVHRLIRKLQHKDPATRKAAVKLCLDFPESPEKGYLINELDGVADADLDEAVRKEAVLALQQILQMDLLKEFGFSEGKK